MLFRSLAETLDRSQNGVVKKVDVRERAGALRLHVYSTDDSELEVWAANKQLSVLAEVLDRPMTLAAHHIRDADEPARAATTQPSALARRAS